MPFQIQPGAVHRSRRGARFLGAAVVLATLMACDSLLNVSSPSRIPAKPIETASNSVLLASGAEADFDCALGSFIVVGGELTDEFEDATETAARWIVDRRAVPSDGGERYAAADCDGGGTYIPINRARESADNLIRILTAATDADMPSGVSRDSLIGVMSAYAGYARVMLGEMFCSSVISTLNPDGSITFGTEMTPAQMFASADSMFTAAIAAAQTDGDQVTLNMAYVGRARTRLDLGDYAAAAADAELVPSTFDFKVDESTINSRRTNRIWAESNLTSTASSVGPRYQNMRYPANPAGKLDPRVKAVQLNTPPLSNGLVQWAQLKYADGATAIPVARWAEAQLIIAEADARANDVNGAIGIINELHAAVGLDNYSGPTDQASVLAAVIDERSRELFLEGQRLGDVIRNNITLDPPEGTAYRNGGKYGPSGNKLCLLLPDNEKQGNPNF